MITMGKKQESAGLPEFKNEAEAAAFWDTHSPEDFPEQFEVAEVKCSRPLIKRGLTIKLSEEAIAELRRLGQEKGVGPSTLVRMWILERLRGLRGKTA